MSGKDFKVMPEGYNKQRDVLYWLRKSRKMSRREVYEKIGIRNNTLSDYENKRKCGECSTRVIMLLCSLYGVRVSKFYKMVELAEAGCDVEKLVGDMLHE